jgi:putative (di)nucleoside polyphosphate hydrolase
VTEPRAKPDISRLPYRKGVGLMIFNERGEILVARRIDMPSEAWQMPQGGIDAGEDPRQAALREMNEEIGTGKAEIVAESRRWLSYDLPAELVPKIWHGRYRGQTQKWFLLRFTGRDGDIRIDTHEPEFSAWRWAPLASLPRLIVPFKRRLYADLVAEFGPRIRELTGRT